MGWWYTRPGVRALVVSAAIVLAVAAALAPITPAITFNNGLGYDGKEYAAMVAAFRGQPGGTVLELHANRFLPTGLVAALPFDVKAGFTLLNLASAVATAPLLVVLLRRYGATTGPALVGVVWWALLPPGVRNGIYFPVQIEAIGFFIQMLLITLALSRRYALFAIALAAAVITREHLLFLVPFVWLACRREGVRRATTVAFLVSIPALVVYAAARAFPPIQIEAIPPSAADILWQSVRHLPDPWRRYLAALPLSLGILAIIPLVRGRSSLAFVREQIHWAYFLVTLLAITLVGGNDHDHNHYTLAPLALILSICVAAPRSGWTPGVALALTAVQLLITRSVWPLGPDEASYLEFPSSTMATPRLLQLSLLNAAGSIAVAAILWARGSRRLLTSPGALADRGGEQPGR